MATIKNLPLPKEYTKGLEWGDDFQFEGKDYTYQVYNLIYSSNGTPETHGLLIYIPSITPVANPSAIQMKLIEVVDATSKIKIIRKIVR